MSTTTVTSDLALPSAEGNVPADRAARRRAFFGIMRLEWRRQLLTLRVLWPLALAALPIAVTAAMVFVVTHVDPSESASIHSEIFPNLYHALVVRVVIFFGCLALFMNLVRGEVEERTMHYLLLTPVPRPLLVVAKYLAAVGSSCLLFVTATIVSFLLVQIPNGLGSAFTGPALSQLAAYCGMTVLGCIGYGGAFLLLGSVLRSPGPFVALFFAWEWFEIFLPPMLKQVSVAHYIKQLTPVPIAEGPFALLVDPTPVPLAVLQMAIYAAVTVTIAAWATSRTDLDYGKG